MTNASHSLRLLTTLMTGLLLSGSAAAGTFCADKDDGTYAHPDNAAQFVSCAADGLIEATFDCPSGLLWNDPVQYCDWPENVASVDAPVCTYSLLFEEAACDGHSSGPDGAIVGQINGVEDIDACMEGCLEEDECNSFAIGIQGDVQYCFFYTGDASQSDAHLVDPTLPRYPEYDCYTVDF